MSFVSNITSEAAKTGMQAATPYLVQQFISPPVTNSQEYLQVRRLLAARRRRENAPRYGWIVGIGLGIGVFLIAAFAK